MYKSICSAILIACLGSSSLFAVQAPELPTQCPSLSLISINPLKIKINVADPENWRTNIHDIDKAAMNNQVLILEVMPPRSIVDQAAADTSAIETPLIEDVMIYEDHVLTHTVSNINKVETIPLAMCTYGLWWKKYHKKLFYTDTENFGVATWKTITFSEKYYYIHYSLIELRPYSYHQITLSVPSLLDNDTGWTKNYYGTGFDCYHDSINDKKCTWTNAARVINEVILPHGVIERRP